MGFEFSVRVEADSAGLQWPVIHDADTGDYSEAWPTVPEQWLTQAMQRLTPAERNMMLRQKHIAYAWFPTCSVHAVVNEAAAQHCRRQNLNVVGRVPLPLYRQLVRRHFGPQLLREATFGLAQRSPEASAHYRLSKRQGIVLTLGLCCAMLISYFTSVWMLSALAQVLAALFFLTIIMLRCLCLMPLPRSPRVHAASIPEWGLPVYTVLVPLFRETAVLGQLLGALDALDYPRDKLDIKIILEENDRPMLAAVVRLDLPCHFDVVVVPTGKPQTKPRALNYAMQFARGSLVTIFDCEDIPQPNQLRLAAAKFATADEDVGCLQAALQFYNPHENWLTRQFAAEYGGLFHVILPALAANHLPLPLGGTSNHLRASALAAVGGWDAFNVTEDADLGMRLARCGYRSETLRSVTFEEATKHLPNWMRQRRRWLKGFLQTWLVHMRSPVQTYRELGTSAFLTLQAMTIGVFASALLHPFLVAHTFWNLSPERMSGANLILAGFSFAILVAGYGFAIATNILGLKRAGLPASPGLMLTLPFYWLLITCAAWMALWDLLVAPFHWHKTQHGLSAFMQQ